MGMNGKAKLGDPLIAQKAQASKAAKRAAKVAVGLTLDWGRADAIRAKCLDCSRFAVSEITACVVKDCPLWPFRRGAACPPEEFKAWEARYMASEDGARFLGRREGKEEEA